MVFRFIGIKLFNQKTLKEIVTVMHDGTWREEIEIAKKDENGQSFDGTITMTEAKHGL